MKASDGAALSLFLAGMLVLSLTFAGLVPFALTGGGPNGCIPGANAFNAYINSQGDIEMDGFSCTGTGANGGVAVYGWAVDSAGSTVQSVKVTSNQYGDFALVFGALPAGSYSVTASLCPQSGQSGCSGETNWVTAFTISTFVNSQSSTVTVITGQSVTTNPVMNTTTSGCTSNCGNGKPFPMGYWISLAFLVSGTLVFALGREEER